VREKGERDPYMFQEKYIAYFRNETNLAIATGTFFKKEKLRTGTYI